MKHNVVQISTGQEAIDEFKKNRYSIVFLDIQLPIKNGFQVSEEIRKYEDESRRGERKIPIIGISGTGNDYEELAFKSGMDDFIKKGENLQYGVIQELLLKYCGKDQV
jgi:CheY-like chemotaxis protein